MGRGVIRRFEGPLRRRAKRIPMIRKVRDELVKRYHGTLLKGTRFWSRVLEGDAATHTGGVDPGNIIWIFCSSRSGSTWLRSMMAEIEGHKVWEEPKVGRLFGDFYRKAQKGQLASSNFIMGDPTRTGWIKSIRNFILDGAHYAQPLLKPGHYLVVKEVDSSAGAPLVMEALPESRMIFLIRDPRDVAASALDATKEGNWMYETVDEAGWKRKSISDKDPDSFVRGRAKTYLRQVESIKEAYNAHKGRKVLIRYEDLRADTLGTMKRIYSMLEIPVDKEALIRAIERHSWEKVPEKEKGEGKFYRKASPGGWRKELTPEQAKVVERITAPLLEEFYPEENTPDG